MQLRLLGRRYAEILLSVNPSRGQFAKTRQPAGAAHLAVLRGMGRGPASGGPPAEVSGRAVAKRDYGWVQAAVVPLSKPSAKRVAPVSRRTRNSPLAPLRLTR